MVLQSTLLPPRLGAHASWVAACSGKAHSVLRFRVGRSVWCCRAHRCESVEEWYWDGVALAIRKQIFVCVSLYARTYARTYMQAHVCTYAHEYMHVQEFIHVACMHMRTYTCMRACMRPYTHTHTHTHTYTYIHTSMHTHTCTHTRICMPCMCMHTSREAHDA